MEAGWSRGTGQERVPRVDDQTKSAHLHSVREITMSPGVASLHKLAYEIRVHYRLLHYYYWGDGSLAHSLRASLVRFLALLGSCANLARLGG